MVGVASRDRKKLTFLVKTMPTLLALFLKKQKRIRRSKWLQRHRQFCLYNNLMRELESEDANQYKRLVRVPPEMFHHLLDSLRPALSKDPRRSPILPGVKLAVTLQHLGHGTSYTCMANFWRFPHNTISVIVREVCLALIDQFLIEYLSPPSNEEEWLQTARDFEEVQ